MEAMVITMPSTAIRRELRRPLDVTMPTFESRTSTIGNSITRPKARKRTVTNPKYDSAESSRWMSWVWKVKRKPAA